MKSVCVFCGSSTGNDPAYLTAARELGRALAGAGHTLVYGGASVGLMGAVADAARDSGGRVVGVIPESLVEKEIAHQSLDELRVVGSMHERKAMMNDLSDGFIALPGGNGTLEEFFEVLTWAQLGEHGKPCGLLNAAGYYDLLQSLFDHMVEQGFLRQEHREMVLTGSSPEELLERMTGYRPPKVAKWIDRPQT